MAVDVLGTRGSGSKVPDGDTLISSSSLFLSVICIFICFMYALSMNKLVSTIKARRRCLSVHFTFLVEKR